MKTCNEMRERERERGKEMSWEKSKKKKLFLTWKPSFKIRELASIRGRAHIT